MPNSRKPFMAEHAAVLELFFLSFRLRNCRSDVEVGTLSRGKAKKSAVKMELGEIMREGVKCNEVSLRSEESKRGGELELWVTAGRAHHQIFQNPQRRLLGNPRREKAWLDWNTGNRESENVESQNWRRGGTQHANNLVMWAMAKCMGSESKLWERVVRCCSCSKWIQGQHIVIDCFHNTRFEHHY